MAKRRRESAIERFEKARTKVARIYTGVDNRSHLEDLDTPFGPRELEGLWRAVFIPCPADLDVSVCGVGWAGRRPAAQRGQP